MEPEITVIIIDDDLGSIQKLQNDLLAFSEVRILDTATTAELGKRHILKIVPTKICLFSDIYIQESQYILAIQSAKK